MGEVWPTGVPGPRLRHEGPQLKTDGVPGLNVTSALRGPANDPSGGGVCQPWSMVPRTQTLPGTQHWPGPAAGLLRGLWILRRGSDPTLCYFPFFWRYIWVSGFRTISSESGLDPCGCVLTWVDNCVSPPSCSGASDSQTRIFKKSFLPMFDHSILQYDS